jgi:hypothetical protein
MTDDQRNWSSGEAGSVDSGNSAVTAGGSSTLGGRPVVTGDADVPSAPTSSRTSAGQAASQAVDKAKDAADQAAQQAGQAAAPIADQAQETAGQVAEQAKQQAVAQISTQKEHAAGSLDAVAQALRQSGDQLRSKQQEPLANLAGTAAQRIEDFSGYVRNTDVNDMIRDVEAFARRQPAAFLGGAFTLGVLAARFLKSSSQKEADQGGVGSGRTPSYRGYSANPYSTSGTSRYPAPSRYPAGTSATGLGGVGVSTPSTSGLGTASAERATDRYGSSVAPSSTSPSGGGTAGSGVTAGGWGYTPRSGTRAEGEGP